MSRPPPIAYQPTSHTVRAANAPDGRAARTLDLLSAGDILREALSALCLAALLFGGCWVTASSIPPTKGHAGVSPPSPAGSQAAAGRGLPRAPLPAVSSTALHDSAKRAIVKRMARRAGQEIAGAAVKVPGPLVRWTIARYIRDCDPSLDADSLARTFWDSGTAGGMSPLLMASLGRYESSFDPGDIGAAGELGMLQVHPIHRHSMSRAGLQFGNREDELAFACILYRSEGLRPWAVRAKAQRDYERLLADLRHQCLPLPGSGGAEAIQQGRRTLRLVNPPFFAQGERLPGRSPASTSGRKR